MTPSPGLWTKWYKLVAEDPPRFLRPRRVAAKDILLRAWLVADKLPEFPDYYVIHEWVVTHDDPETPVLLPGPWLMARSLDEAHALIPDAASRLPNVPMLNIYCEAWM